MAEPQRYRNFDVARVEHEPVVFDVTVIAADGTTRAERFTCAARPPLGITLDLIAAESSYVISAERYIRGVLLTDDRARWDELLRDPDWLVGADDIAEVANWLMETYAGRPTSPSSDSAPGPSDDGALSTADASSPDSIPTASISAAS